MDWRVLVEETMAVAQTAMQTGVARTPIADMDAYREKLIALAHKLQQPRS
jgi:malic enzyme